MRCEKCGCTLFSCQCKEGPANAPDLQAEIVRLRAINADLLTACEALHELVLDHETRIENEWGSCRSPELLEQEKAWSEQVYQARDAMAAAKEHE